MERRLLLDVVVGERAAVLELFSGEDQPLLVRRNALLVLDLLFDVVDRVRRLHVQRDGLARQRLDEDLRSGESSGRVDGVGSRRWRLVDLILALAAVSPHRREFSPRFKKDASCAVVGVCVAIAATAQLLHDV